jgi:alkylation response protein AidB-like acyl-CoA dehydrogenase
VAWARETRRSDGARVIDAPWVQANLARARAAVNVLRLLTWRQAWNIDQGKLDPAESSTVKVFGTESFIRIYGALLEVLGQEGYLKDGSPGARLRARIERFYRTSIVLTFGGGTNEVQRDIIATTGLAMPRAPR